MDLGLNKDELNACVQCGLCLSACPTYAVTHDEARSPRGRIALMRSVHNGGATVDHEVEAAFSTCVQCRACESACPSLVQFGHLMEDTRAALDSGGPRSRPWLRLAYRILEHPRLLRAGSIVLAVVQRVLPLPRRIGLPTRLPVRRAPLAASGTDVYLFTGCVMDAFQRDTHLATQRVLEAAGVGVEPTGSRVPCCGALHVHAGFRDKARSLAQATIKALAQDRPILVNSAGCGAALKDYARLLGTDEAAAFSARVFDVQEWLAPRVSDLPRVSALDMAVAVQDPCHLRHVQRVHTATRTVLDPFVERLVELDDDGMCCGAGGAYAVLEPDLASAIRSRKLDAIGRARADVVASANPGCSLHLAAAGVNVAHPMEIIDRAIRLDAQRG